MKVTLAMGLKYEHSPKQLPLQGRDDFSAHLNSTQPVIDVEPITPTSEPKISKPYTPRLFDYITYNKTADLVPIPYIGTQLDTLI